MKNKKNNISTILFAVLILVLVVCGLIYVRILIRSTVSLNPSVNNDRNGLQPQSEQ